MARFVFVQYGFEPPTDEIMAAWRGWFEMLGDRVVASYGPLIAGVAVNHDGVEPLEPRGGDATGISIVEADDLAEAQTLAEACPFIDGVHVYEIMQR